MYQNAIALDNAKSYKNSNYALPELPLIHVAIDGDRTYEFEMVNEGAHMAPEAIDDEETQEMLDIMEFSFSRDDNIVSNGMESDSDDDDVDDRGIIDDDSEDDEDCSDSGSMESGRSDDIDHAPGGNDVTPGTKRRAQLLNFEADDLDWENEDGFLERGNVRVAARGRGRGTRVGRGRGRAARSHAGEAPPPRVVDLAHHQLERRNEMATNVVQMQQSFTHIPSMYHSGVHLSGGVRNFSSTLGGVFQPPFVQQHSHEHHNLALPPTGQPSMQPQLSVLPGPPIQPSFMPSGPGP